MIRKLLGEPLKSRFSRCDHGCQWRSRGWSKLIQCSPGRGAVAFRLFHRRLASIFPTRACRWHRRPLAHHIFRADSFRACGSPRSHGNPPRSCARQCRQSSQSSPIGAWALFTRDRHDAERCCSTSRRSIPKCYKPRREHKMSGFGSKFGSNGLFRYLATIGKCY